MGNDDIVHHQNVKEEFTQEKHVKMDINHLPCTDKPYQSG